ncbi:hypothetical protein V6R86_07335 [Sphingomonas kaistensis]|uniref:Uncharacterized protein n=1 Tax=Sphingomonas kaistensis TaxID=298708 RepID=A0ABZ2G0R2_9SPHN
MLRSVSAAGSAVMMMLWATAASAQVATAIEADAIAFGTRESVRNMGLSPDGKQAVFVGPGPGRTTIAYHVDIAVGATKPILKASGNPERLQWCEFASDRRLVCRFYAMVQGGAGLLLPSTRTISLNIDGTDIKALGQRETDYDQGLRQTDGAVIDWLPGNGDEILMSRLYVPQGPRAASLSTVRNKQGVGVVKVDTRTLRSIEVEPARRQVGSFLSDGRGNVRVQGISEETGDGQLTGRRKYQYRIAGSRDWRDLEPYQDGEFIPLAVDGDFFRRPLLPSPQGRPLCTHPNRAWRNSVGNTRRQSPQGRHR